MAGLLLAGVLTGPTPAAVAAEPTVHKGPPPGRLVLQSMLLPGSGQFSNRKWIKAVGFAGAYTGLVAWGISLNQDVQDERGRFNAGLATRDDVDSLEDQRNAKFWFAGLTMILSMVDAYVDAHLSGFDDRIDAEVGWVPSGDDHLLGVRITTSWGETAGPGNRGS